LADGFLYGLSRKQIGVHGGMFSYRRDREFNSSGVESGSSVFAPKNLAGFIANAPPMKLSILEGILSCYPFLLEKNGFPIIASISFTTTEIVT